ncbi:MAG: sulfatase-like hydrolase/transferase [Lentisphaeria bacterium]|nr:sulfatase-like hydrolase/transferase [Lentisphaeria bacterium]
MNRRGFLGVSGTGAAAWALSRWASAAAPPARQPNFLVIMADDLSPGHFGCYGGSRAKTPHLDALARSGVCFRTCWATPMCAPSRAMIATGRYAHRTGIYHNGLAIPTGKFPARQWAREHLTFARLLREHGYATALAGKIMEMGGRIGSPEVGFQEYCHHVSNGKLPDGKTFEGVWESDRALPGWSGPVASRYWHPCLVRNGEAVPTSPDLFGEDVCADFLVDFIRRHRDAPFLAYYPMNLPHGTATGKLPTTPLSGRPGQNQGGAMAECVSYIDVLVGRLLTALEETGQLRHTLVLFTSDNGDAGWGKTWATEEGARVPLLAGGPTWLRQRGPADQLVSLADIFPTLAELAGAGLPEGYDVDGCSLAAFLCGETDRTRDVITSSIGTGRMVRDRRWLLEAVDPVGGHPRGRLYDCGTEREPGQYREMTDSQEPEAIEARRRLEKVLGDTPFLNPEDPATAKALEAYRKHPYPHRLGPRPGARPPQR